QVPPLAPEQPACDGYSQWAAQLAALPRRQHQRQRAEDGGKRRHQDRAEARDAGLEYRLGGRQTALALALERKIDEHDAVLLNEADQQDDTDEGDQRQIDLEHL